MRPPPVRLRLLLTPPERDDLPESALEATRIPGSFARGLPPVCVIDVLRATTTLAHAFAAGAGEAIFFASPESAIAARRAAEGRALLCGERDGRRIPGFDLGNSPGEYERRRIEGVTMLFATTNGSRAFLATHDAAVQWGVAFVNLEAAVATAQAWLEGRPPGETKRAPDEDDDDEDRAPDLLVVCAGKLGRPAPEDTACAARFALRLVGRLAQAGSDVEVQAEGSVLSHAPESQEETERIVRGSEHGRYLASLGREFEADLAAASRWDSLDVVPEGRGARLVAPRARGS